MHFYFHADRIHSWTSTKWLSTLTLTSGAGKFLGIPGKKQKLRIFPRNLLGFLGFHANEEAGKMSNFSQESLDKITAFPEAGRMIVTENIHPPFPGILGKPGSRKLEIGPPVSLESWDYLESWEESTKISQENWDYSGSLEKFTIYSWESLEKSIQLFLECQNLSETVDKLNGQVHVKGLVPGSLLALAYITHLMFSTTRQTFEKLTEAPSLHCPKRS